MSQRYCDKCRVESKQLFLCRQNDKEWYQCGDSSACAKRAREIEEQKHRLAQEARDMKFQAQYADIDLEDLIPIGVLYKDATTYYYHAASDSLFGKSLIDDEISRRDKPISSYERLHIHRICGV